MKYRVYGNPMPAASIVLDQGESIFTQSGGMAWMTGGIVMETNMKGGLAKGLGRMLTGESLFMATYTATRPQEEITIASSFPGDIVVFDVSGGREYILQKNAFLCAQTGVELSAEVVRGLGRGLFGGEGFILQRVKGQGLIFAEMDGSVVEYDLMPGQLLRVDTGHVAAFESSVNYQVEAIKGFKNVLFGGEGLFLTVLEGPGKVWLQTMTMSGIASKLAPYTAKKD